jgi:hypothetical protein
MTFSCFLGRMSLQGWNILKGNIHVNHMGKILGLNCSDILWVGTSQVGFTVIT